jgi:hypothetical protein
MSRFVSVALFKRGGNTVFKPARKEASPEKTQARKSASRFWNGNIIEPDKLTKVIVVEIVGQIVHVSERGHARSWVDYRMTVAEAAKQAHLAACLAELGIDPAAALPPMPDTLEINGVIYRREI